MKSLFWCKWFDDFFRQFGVSCLPLNFVTSIKSRFVDDIIYEALVILKWPALRLVIEPLRHTPANLTVVDVIMCWFDELHYQVPHSMSNIYFFRCVGGTEFSIEGTNYQYEELGCDDWPLETIVEKGSCGNDDSATLIEIGFPVSPDTTKVLITSCLEKTR